MNIIETRTITDVVSPQKPKRRKQISEKGWRHYMNNFRPESSDVIICTAGWTGTTWLQAICHFLRGGTEDFEDISQVVPWHVFAYDLDFDIMDQQGLRPRLFKSHQFIAAEKRGCKYITTIRDPIRKLMSGVAFQNEKKGTNWPIDDVWEKQDASTLLTFKNTLEHFTEAYKLRNHPQVLVVCYEHLVEDTKNMLSTIARFLGIQHPSEKLLERTLWATSKEQMLIDVSKYSETWGTRRYNELGRGALARIGENWIPAPKVTGLKHKKPSKHIEAKITSFVNNYLYEKIGVRNYEELRMEIGHFLAMRESFC